ncbi:hypothetical protein [Flavobacterium muglaense]|uniref:Helix-turn-helix domain-containing protein n=1 Tax=Flavobacterium muglaense TaxID=2764716 RepID=A0A923SEC1_9FLAO|nr:hypothetical protein [Flavobacterium muglaense]MBC5836800.1 hypothetical protein [Flavobacterium muglaense]MBC5843250.1 hypothetical protein [Flavobacterium muglaense]
MKNNNTKNVIRNNNKPKGTYFNGSLHILHNNKLSDFEVRLFFSILSDSDDFKFNVLTYANRFGKTTKTIGRAINNLENEGYIIQTQKTNRKNVWDYVISEYGDLKQTNSKVEVQTELITIDINNESKEVIVDITKDEIIESEQANESDSLFDWMNYQPKPIISKQEQFKIDEQERLSKQNNRILN